MREQALAAETALSRHTVRTALARLTAESLVTQESYRGTRVRSFSAEDVQALQQLRCALEAEAVRLTRERHGRSWPDQVTAPVHKAMAELEIVGSAHPGDWPRVTAAHAGGHRAVVATASSSRIQDAYAQLDSEMLLLLVNLRPTYSAEEVVDDHRDYLRQIQIDGEKAVRRHLAHGTRQIWPRSSRAPNR